MYVHSRVTLVSHSPSTQSPSHASDRHTYIHSSYCLSSVVVAAWCRMQLVSPHTSHRAPPSMPLLTVGLLLLVVLSLLCLAAYFVYPRWTVYRQRRAVLSQLTKRLALLLNTRESLVQHIDWAKADNLTDRAAALTREVRSIDGEVEGVEKELKMMEAERRRMQY